MTLEEWIRSQLELRATPEIRLGRAQDDSEVTFMSWSDKMAGTWFWRVVGSSVELIAFTGDDST